MTRHHTSVRNGACNHTVTFLPQFAFRSGIFLLEALTLVISIGIFVLQNVLERAAKSETLKSIAERVTGKRAAQQEGQDE